MNSATHQSSQQPLMYQQVCPSHQQLQMFPQQQQMYQPTQQLCAINFDNRCMGCSCRNPFFQVAANIFAIWSSFSVQFIVAWLFTSSALLILSKLMYKHAKEPDREFNWILRYINLTTHEVRLRPLRSGTAHEQRICW
uniref:Uncharacterized protein n=1 Tax=Ditylenchus dipsaci TaxID=166011 RepID=A0A915D1H3_9BILA